MQIDFHHGTTYVLARLAGMPRPQAEIVACAAQYVDDATNGGPLRFENGALYDRIASAHRMLDYRNFKTLANHKVWVPYHFLPGNGGLEAGKIPQGKYVDRLVCTPGSPVAEELVRGAILGRSAPYALHRLGIVMHVYADTWAHQGFAGVNDDINEVHEVTGPDGKPDQDIKNRLLNYFIGEAMPLGHGAALSYPDLPWLSWGYTNGRGKPVHRDNTAIYLEASERVLVALRRYVAGNPDARVQGLSPRDRDALHTLFVQCRDRDGELRHKVWLDAIADGTFSFGRDAGLRYIPKGPGSWKHAAVSTTKDKDDDGELFPYRPTFLQSDWKRFHDASQVFRLDLLVHILPRFGIVAA